MKIVCPFCEKINDVKNGTEICSCGACGSSFLVDEGKDYTVKKYRELQTRGYTCLHRTNEFDEAIDCFLYSLEIKPNDLTSIMGLCLAKISQSTMLEDNFNCVESTINEYEVYLNTENTMLFLSFVRDLMDQVNYYITESDGRVIVDGAYISKAYFDAYIKALKNIDGLFTYLTDAFTLMEKEQYDNYCKDDPEFMARFDKYQKKIKDRLNKSYMVNNVGLVKVVDGEEVGVDTTEVPHNEVTELEDNAMIRTIYKGLLYHKIALGCSIACIVAGLVFVFVYAGTSKLWSLITGVVLVIAAFAIFFIIKLVLKLKTQPKKKK